MNLTARKKLSEAICPSSANSYLGLCTVIQAFPLANLFWVVGAHPKYEEAKQAFETVPFSFSNFPIIQVLEVVMVIYIVAGIWHRYAIDINFVSWPLNFADTVIPFAFATVESFLALSILACHIVWFEAWLATILLIGCLSYAHCLRQHIEPHSKQLFLKHFEETGLGTQAYQALYDYLSYSIQEMAAYFWLTLLMSSAGIREKYQVWVIFIVVNIIMIRLFMNDGYYSVRKGLEPKGVDG